MADDNSLLVRFGSINCKPQGGSSLGAAIGHNKRTQKPSQSSEIDSSQSHSNIALFELPATADEVIALSKSMMEEAQFKPKRIDSVIAVEVLFSLRSANLVQDLTLYFSDCAKWAEGRFKGQLLSADIHLDEPHPHCHAIILLPLTSNGQSGSKLIGSMPAIRAHSENFMAKVGNRYGLRMQSAKLTGEEKKKAAILVLNRLREDSDPAMVSAIWPATVKAINSCPDTFMVELDIPFPTKTFKEYAMWAGKGPKTAAGEAGRDRRLGYSLAAS